MAEQQESRAAAVRRVVMEHGPMTREEICLHLGVAPNRKGTQSVYRNALNNAVSSGWIAKTDDGRFVTGDMSRLGPRTFRYIGQTEMGMARYIQEHGPATRVELADEVGLSPSALRIHIDRICVRAGTASDKRSALYRLKEGWDDHVQKLQGKVEES